LLNKPSGTTKYFTSGSGVPALKLSFVVVGLSEEEVMDEEDSGDKFPETGTLKLQL